MSQELAEERRNQEEELCRHNEESPAESDYHSHAESLESPVATPSPTACCENAEKVAELKSRNLFLEQSLKGLEEENLELRQVLFDNAAIYEELRSAHRALQQDANKQNHAYQTHLSKMEEKINSLLPIICKKNVNSLQNTLIFL